MGAKRELKNQLRIFLGFLVFGIVLGLIENIIAINFSTDHSINIRAILIAILVVIPFAAIGELVVDRITLLPRSNKKIMGHLEIILEFTVFGVFMGIVEDLIVIGLLTGESITLQTVWIVTLVTLPFAIISEIIVDRHDWFPGVKTKSEKAQ